MADFRCWTKDFIIEFAVDALVKITSTRNSAHLIFSTYFKHILIYFIFLLKFEIII